MEKGRGIEVFRGAKKHLEIGCFSIHGESLGTISDRSWIRLVKPNI